MHDFVFHNPTKIIFGRDTESRLGAELRQHGIENVLFVYGRDSIKKSGLHGRIVASLREAGIAFHEFGGVSSNPVLTHVRQGIDKAKMQGVDGVLAVGGGSVLDEGKAIAAGARTDNDIWYYFTGTEVRDALPVFTVPTLAATGSEMNGNSVVTNEETRQKFNISSPLIYPRLSILNPALTFTVPPDYTAYGAVDAIAHVIEGYFTQEAGAPLLDRLVENIITTIMNNHESIMKHPDHYESRAEFMWAATLALNGLTTAGTRNHSFPNHMIEHSLSALYNIPHGAGLSIVIPAWMKWYSARRPDRFWRFAYKVFGLADAEAGIKALERWFNSIKTPTRLRDVSIPERDIEKIADNCGDLAELWGLNHIYTREVLIDILRLAA